MENPDSTPTGYALYDLDHTIIPFDTQVLFCNFVLQREWWRRSYCLIFIPLIPLAVLKILSLRTMKRVFSSYLAEMPEQRLRDYAREFAETVFQKAAYPEVLAKIEEDRTAGRTLILNSASPDFYVQEIARVLRFDHYLGTRLVIEDPMSLIPQITGPNNKHGEKITAMQTAGIIPQDLDYESSQKLPDSRAYSDSSADVPLLSICQEGTMIHPSENFAAIGKERGWKTLLPERPYSGKWGGRLASVLQAFGLWRM